MAKFTNPSKLSEGERNELLSNFCEAISVLKNGSEVASFLKDLLSPQEAEMLAKRVMVAELLIKGKTYSEISHRLKLSQSTIARVHEWLKISGDGFRLILERKPGESFSGKSLVWGEIKRRYPIYYWPQILLEGIIASAKERDKRKLDELIKEMDKKSELYKRLKPLLK